MLRATAILLDLDGTLTDSGPAIAASVAETLASFGRSPLPQDELLRFVGPPIREAFREIAGAPEPELDALVADYRTRYRTRMLDVPVFPGVAELVRSWHAAGVPLALATAKLTRMAVPIVEHTGLASCLTAVCGASVEDSATLPGVQLKANVVGRALEALADAGADLTRPVMVGDRHHDVEGAALHGVDSVLVAWGYARPGEEAGAVAVARDAAELDALLAPAARV